MLLFFCLCEVLRGEKERRNFRGVRNMRGKMVWKKNLTSDLCWKISKMILFAISHRTYFNHNKWKKKKYNNPNVGTKHWSNFPRTTSQSQSNPIVMRRSFDPYLACSKANIFTTTTNRSLKGKKNKLTVYFLPVVVLI